MKETNTFGKLEWQLLQQARLFLLPLTYLVRKCMGTQVLFWGKGQMGQKHSVFLRQKCNVNLTERLHKSSGPFGIVIPWHFCRDLLWEEVRKHLTDWIHCQICLSNLCRTGEIVLHKNLAWTTLGKILAESIALVDSTHLNTVLHFFDLQALFNPFAK